MDTKLRTPFTMLVAASSNSGKTKLIRDLVVNNKLTMDKPIDELIWLHHKNAKDDELIRDISSSMNVPVRFIEGYPEGEISNSTLFKTDGLKCLVIDDIVHNAIRSASFTELFTIISHHENMIVIAILQNLYAYTPAQRQQINNVIRNCSYLVLFPERRSLASCRQLANAYFSGEQYRLLEPFKSVMKDKEEYQYLVIDFLCQNEDMQVRLNGLRPKEKSYNFTFSS